MLTKLEQLRVPPASLTPGAPRDRPSASQVAQQKPDHRAGPDPARPAQEAGPTASSPRVPRRPARRATDPRRRRRLGNNQIDGTFPLALCNVQSCYATYSNPDLVAPCGSKDCCDLGDGTACPVTIFGVDYDPETTVNLRAPPAFPTPGAARDTASAS